MGQSGRTQSKTIPAIPDNGKRHSQIYAFDDDLPISRLLGNGSSSRL